MHIEKLTEVLANQPKYRIKQAQEAIFKNLVDNWDQAMTFPLAVREKLNEECPLEIEGEVFASDDSKTIKALITLFDGKKIETVLMRHRDGRHTVCVSSQVGCALGCSFCATGEMGFERNLNAIEIVAQVLFFARYVKKHFSPDDKITNVVFMGMGEPFLNYQNVMSAVRTLNSESGLNIGARKISISTSGIIEGIKNLADENIQVNLAVSLHAVKDDLRSSLMPINRKYPLKKVMLAIDEYIEKTKRQVMIEYMLIKDVNDSASDASKLVELLRGKLVAVNLILCNPVGKYKSSSPVAISKFKSIVEREGIVITQRHRFGREIDAACGQLATRKKYA